MTYPNLTEEQSKRAQEFSRAQVEAMCAYIEAERRLTELERENAKLRELVAQMYPRAKAFLQMGVRLGCNDTLSYDWELQMQELGIEVSE